MFSTMYCARFLNQLNLNYLLLMAIVKGLVQINLLPTGRKSEPEQQYKQRIVNYLKKLLYERYKGRAHEINYQGDHVFANDLKEEQVFRKHHHENGWNTELDIEIPDDYKSIYDTDDDTIEDTIENTEYTNDDHSIEQETEIPEEWGKIWTPEHDVTPHAASRGDYIHWTRAGKDNAHKYLSVYLIKYYQYIPKKGIATPLNGVLFAEQCKPEDIENSDSKYYRIGRTIRTLTKMLTEDRVAHSVEFTLNNKPVTLPPSQEDPPINDLGFLFF